MLAYDWLAVDVSDRLYLVQVVVEEGQEWSFYDAGPRVIQNPLVFLPPVSGTADIYFRQLLSLSAVGCRAIAVSQQIRATSWLRLSPMLSALLLVICLLAVAP